MGGNVDSRQYALPSALSMGAPATSPTAAAIAMGAGATITMFAGATIATGAIAVAQYRQIIDGAKVLQQKSMNCIKYILHLSVHGPVWRSEKVPVSPTGNHLQKDRVVMDVEIIHCKAE